jgi:hypothetical protein
MSKDIVGEIWETRLVSLDERGLDSGLGRILRLPISGKMPHGGLGISARPRGDSGYARSLVTLPFGGKPGIGEVPKVSSISIYQVPNRSESYALMTRLSPRLDTYPILAEMTLTVDCSLFATEQGIYMADWLSGLAVHTRDWTVYPLDRLQGVNRAWGIQNWSIHLVHSLTGERAGEIRYQSDSDSLFL